MVSERITGAVRGNLNPSDEENPVISDDPEKMKKHFTKMDAE